MADKTNSGNAIKITAPGIAAKELGDNLEIEITNNDDFSNALIYYSPMTFVARKWNDSKDGSISRALYCYYKAAVDYFEHK